MWSEIHCQNTDRKCMTRPARQHYFIRWKCNNSPNRWHSDLTTKHDRMYHSMISHFRSSSNRIVRFAWIVMHQSWHCSVGFAQYYLCLSIFVWKPFLERKTMPSVSLTPPYLTMYRHLVFAERRVHEEHQWCFCDSHKRSANGIMTMSDCNYAHTWPCWINCMG